MKKTLFPIALLLLLLPPACKKNAPFECTLTGFYYDESYPTDFWVLFHNAEGEVLDVQRFYPGAGLHDYTFTSEALDPALKYHITIAGYRKGIDHVFLQTMASIGNGQHPLEQYLSVAPSCGNCRSVNGDLSIRNAPEIDYLDCLGTDNDHEVIITSPAPDLHALISTWSGGSGISLALKPKNEPEPRYLWLPNDGSGYFMDTVEYSQFQTDWPATTFSFPFQSRWTYNVAGVTADADLPVFGNLGDKEAQNADPLTDHFSIRRPAQVSFEKLWVSASDVVGGKYYEYVLPVSGEHAFPEVPFRAKSLDFSNSSQIYCSIEGDFDALQLYMFGDGGKTYWGVEGAPEDVKLIRMPAVPDSLRQQWPNLNAFTVGYSICGEIDGVDGYAGLLQLDPAVTRFSSYWRAKLGYRAEWKQWH